MKKQYLLYIVLFLTICACSASKSTNTGNGNGTNAPTETVVVPEKKIEKAPYSEAINKESVPTQLQDQRTIPKKKDILPARRTFEAIPSVPDSL